MSEAEASPASRGQNIAAFVILALVWGSTWLVIKDQISVVPPAWSVTWRFVIAGLVTLGICAARGEKLALSGEAMRLAAAIGLFQFMLNFQLVYASELHLTSGLVAVLFALMLVPNAIMARVFLKIPIGGRFMAGSGVALAGVALLLAHEYRAAPPGMNVAAGIALAVAALLSASTSNVLQASQTARRTPILPLVGWSMLLGALYDGVYAWAAFGAPQIDPRPQYWMGVVYLALFGTVLTWPLYARLLRDWGPGKAAYNGVAVPVVAMALSTLFEGYRWTSLAVSGALLAMTGLLIALSGRSGPSQE